MKKTLLFLVISLQIASAQEVAINPVLFQKQWKARWISCPNIDQKAYGVYHFRKAFNLLQKPSKFIVHVTGDNRYRLFVNGTPVCSGPARGDTHHWFYESLDLAPYLQAGTNTLAAQVWNMAEHMPVAQVSAQTGLLMQGDSAQEEIVNTDNTWKALRNEAYTPCSTNNGAMLWSYVVVGPGDDVVGEKYPWNWETPTYDDKSWPAARVLPTEAHPEGEGSDNYWTLTPRTIPIFTETRQNISKIRRTKTEKGNMNLSVGSLQFPMVIPAQSKVSILLDQGYETIGYPEILTSGGKGSNIKITYAEALMDAKHQKKHRDEIEGLGMIGYFDIFRPDGSPNRKYRPLWLRTYRYVQVEIETQAEALTINDFCGMYSAYPLAEKASFSSNDASMQDLWKVGWRTAQLCTGETYFDCPYYEQLQYQGDSRIEALLSLYVAGDERIVRKAIKDFYNSTNPEGLQQGRYPSHRYQVITTYSLCWVSMLHDYWMLRPDDAFVKQHLHAVGNILHWFENHIDTKKNMLGPMPWWNYVDWNTAFKGGTPDGANDGNSAVISLQYAYTLNMAAKMYAYFGQERQAEQYLKQAATIAKATYDQSFDTTKGVMADTPEKKAFSQNASIFAVLAGAIPKEQQQAVMQRVLADASLSQATFYFRFYLTEALKKAGMADLYYEQLAPWRDMLKIGLTTFAEKPEPTRSDCHAWSSSPNYDFLATICGIMPAQPGFQKVQISPALGALSKVSGKMPHPKGEISVTFERKGDKALVCDITLPPSTTGRIAWQGKEKTLTEGKQSFVLE